MSYVHLIVEFAPRLALVRLNRPAARNALSHALMRELTACARALAERTDIDAVILTGDAVCFTAGADLKDAAAWADESLSTVARREVAGTGFRMCKAWEELPQITIVAIEGYAIGGGLALALACDWRVMADDAFVSLPEIALGIPLTWGTIPRLVNLLGPARAKRATILCERFGAAEALAMGLVDYTAPKGEALATARELAARTLAMPAAAVRMSKESVNAAALALNHVSGYMAHDQIALASASPEARAARAAALKNRK
ncbi:MAG: enoyl-CoA hydratase/isomerase family protein [Burkholderiales bacterium]|nr:enoyl-CoA hydratase/isomerase family protein [Burkholderiales bacterium]